MKLIITGLLLLFGLSIYAQVAGNTTDAKGLKQGYWVKINPETGFPAYKGTFKDNKPVGLFKYYYPHVDTMHSVMDFRDNGKVGYATMFYESGIIQAKGKYVDEKKDSTWNFYDDKGRIISVENYSAGKKHGKSAVYFMNGILSEEKGYKMDKLDGPYKEYYEDKVLKHERTYDNGKQIGKEVVYFPNGAIESMGYMNKAGQMHGAWITNDKSGKQIKKEVYFNGRRLNDKQAEAWLNSNKGKTNNATPKGKTETKPKTTTTKTPAKGATTNNKGGAKK